MGGKLICQLIVTNLSLISSGPLSPQGLHPLQEVDIRPHYSWMKDQISTLSISIREENGIFRRWISRLKPNCRLVVLVTNKSPISGRVGNSDVLGWSFFGALSKLVSEHDPKLLNYQPVSPITNRNQNDKLLINAPKDCHKPFRERFLVSPINPLREDPQLLPIHPPEHVIAVLLQQSNVNFSHKINI